MQPTNPPAPTDPATNPPAPPQAMPPAPTDPPAAPPQGDPATPSVPPTTPPPSDSDGEPTDLSGYKNLVAKLRNESTEAQKAAKAAAKAASDAQAALKTKEDAEKSEQQKLAERAEAAEKELVRLRADSNTKSIRYAVASAARELGFANPDVAYRLLDLGAIEFDEAGEPQGIADLVKQLADAEPYLVKPETKQPPPPSERSTRNGPGLTPEQEKEHAAAFSDHSRSRF